MKKLIAFALLTITACNSTEPEVKQGREVYANEESIIALREPETRMIVRCYPNDYQPAEYCAQEYEKQGYVRFKDIPNKPAHYDFLKDNTYPTRRWREGETTPRW